MENKKQNMVEVVVDVDNLTHAGEPRKKGDKITMTEGQAKVMESMKVIKSMGAK